MKNLNNWALALFVVGIAIYLAWLGVGVRDCVQRGGVPVLLPTGTQCAAKLR
jgi:hypothetical protein